MSWRTKNEINFLRNIGTFGKNPRNPKTCLEGYIESAKNRVEWGKIDKKVAIRTAKALLNSLQ